MAMNGIVGKIERLQEFFKRLKQILTPGVQVTGTARLFLFCITRDCCGFCRFAVYIVVAF